jgi:copper oxidase (laccase) domain-containing protein
MPAFVQLPGISTVSFVVSHRSDGDFNSDVVDGTLLSSRRQELVPLPWTQLNEVHGSVSQWVETPGSRDGEIGDVIGTDVNNAVLGIWVGDCAPVFLIGEHSLVAVHAGWKGLRDGVLAHAHSLMRTHDDVAIHGFVGPHIGQCCYEFGESDLRVMADLFGSNARGVDQFGRPALNVAACIRSFFTSHDIPLTELGECTGCRAEQYFSHRVRGERERQIVGAWRTT